MSNKQEINYVIDLAKTEALSGDPCYVIQVIQNWLHWDRVTHEPTRNRLIKRKALRRLVKDNEDQKKSYQRSLRR